MWKVKGPKVNIYKDLRERQRSCLVGQGPKREKMRKYGMKNLGEEACAFTFELIQSVKTFVLHDTHK